MQPRAVPTTVFPLVRHLSHRATGWLARTPITPNQITLGALLTGLGAAGCLMIAGQASAVLAGLLLIVSYTLDNCDGEIARMKDMQSRFGAIFDTTTDAVVHAGLFAGLAIGTVAARSA